MGLGDLLEGRVVLSYKADTSQAREEIRKLSGEQKKAAEESVRAIEKQNKSVDDLFKSYVDFRAGAMDAFAIAKAAMEEYSRTLRLSAGAASIDIGRLKTASQGLKSETDLLRVAQAGAQGAFKLTTAEMQEVVKGMLALETKGYDVEDVTNKITKAIQEGAIGQMEEFGVKLESTGNIAEDKRKLMAALAQQVRDVGGNFDTAGSDVQRAGVQWEDTLHKVKMALGEMVAAMGPLLQMLGEAVGIIGQVASVAGKSDFGIGGTAGKAIGFLRRFGLGGVNPVGTVANNVSSAVDFATDGLSGAWWDNKNFNVGSMWDQVSIDDMRQAQEARVQASLAAQAEARRRAAPGLLRALQNGVNLGGLNIPGLDRLRDIGLDVQSGLGLIGSRSYTTGGGPRMQSEYASGWDAFGTDVGRGAGYLQGGLNWLGRGVAAQSNRDASAARANQLAPLYALSQQGQSAAQSIASLQSEFALVAQQGQARESFLAGLFGPVSDFNVYAEGFKLLEGAVTSAFDAWITGSKSFGAAVNEALAAGAAALAKEAIMQSLRHAAYGIGSLAIGGPLAGASAASHFKAAAAWGGVALVAGATAKGLGGKDGAAAAGGYRASSSSSSVSSGPAERVVIIGDVASDSSNRRKGREFRRMSELAEKYARPTGSYHG